MATDRELYLHYMTSYTTLEREPTHGTLAKICAIICDGYTMVTVLIELLYGQNMLRLT